jgi:exopolyphosphatase/guanosine-5'-triphosphate,3'-diphosphate pyrophosphatase
MRYAAVDIGTYSCRLLIADINNNKLTPVHREIETTRLGQKMSSNGHIGGMAMAKTCRALYNFRYRMGEFGVSSYRVVATDVVRQAVNREEFITLAEQECRCQVEVITEKDEARLSYTGVKRGLEIEDVPLVVDLGGGSTEFIKDNGDNFMLSLPIGAVKAVDMSTIEIAKMMSPLSRKKEDFNSNPLVFVGGTATTLVAMKLSLEVYLPDLVHGQVLTRREVADIYNMLELMPLHLRKRLPGLQPERADIIPKGTLIVLLVMESLGKNEITVSESDLLEGIIWKMQDLNQ